MAELIKEHKLPNFTPFQIIGRKKRCQKKIEINGIEVHFPYEVYPNQIEYMKKIIELLDNNINRANYTNIGALESPTGTGKTLCLLCATLSWMNEMRRKQKFGGKILYTTRTHSQITQIIHELRKTCYWPRTAVLASRDISCVNPKIKQNSSGTILNIKCRKNNGLCSYYNGVLQDKRERNNCLDIESLCINGKKETFCPFYQQIESAKTYSDIVFMPYNYIFDEYINQIMGIDVENNIIIIDEAHNIRQVCEESKSIEINNNDFNDIITDIDNLINYDKGEEAMKYIYNNKDSKKKSSLVDISKEALNIEKNNFIFIQQKFNSPKIKIENGGKKLNYIEFFNIFLTEEKEKEKECWNKRRKKKISYKDDDESSKNPNNNKILIVPDVINISNIKDHINFLIDVEKAFQDYYEKGTKISILLKIFNIIYQISENIMLQSSYNFVIENEEIIEKNKETNKSENKIIRKFSIFCFNPQIGLADILKRNPYSIIFTSGTLTPFKIFEDEFQIKFDITLENKHIVPQDQFIFKIISDYSEFGKYKFDFRNRDNINMIKSLGNEIFNYCEMTSFGGILVFFPSYFYLNKCFSCWNDEGIIFKIGRYKKVYIDTAKDKNLAGEIRKNLNKNYIVFSVFRGSSSEGIDFSDDWARMVICVGVPFANTIDKRVKLKIDYLNSINKNKKEFIDGNEWYLIDAMIAVNQALGRVIRHINDYGVLICIDERYNNYEKYFSFWIRDHYKKYKNKNLNIRDFFLNQRQKFKNIKCNALGNQSYKDDNKSGFNSTVNFDKNDIFKDLNKSKEKENIEKNNNDNDINIITIEKLNDDEIDLDSSEENIDNYNVFICVVNDDKIDPTNLLENDFQNEKENKDNDLIEENKNKKIEKKEENSMDIFFEKSQKEGKDLLKSLNDFLNNNKKGFNDILNKYK